LVVIEEPVAARQRQPIVLTHGRIPDDVDAEVEVGDETSHDRELLVVLLAEQRQVWPGCRNELGDHGRHAVEVARPRRTFHRVGQTRDANGGRETVGVHRSCGRDEDDVDTGVVAHSEVVIERPWVVLEIATLAELQWIDEDRHHDDIGSSSCVADQLDVTLVQRSHRGDQCDGLPNGSCGL
jgi:hypothetical protein